MNVERRIFKIKAANLIGINWFVWRWIMPVCINWFPTWWGSVMISLPYSDKVRASKFWVPEDSLSLSLSLSRNRFIETEGQKASARVNWGHTISVHSFFQRTGTGMESVTDQGGCQRLLVIFHCHYYYSSHHDYLHDHEVSYSSVDQLAIFLFF